MITRRSVVIGLALALASAAGAGTRATLAGGQARIAFARNEFARNEFARNEFARNEFARIAFARNEFARHEIQMRAVSFMPAELTIAVGDTVVWRNADIVRHSAVWGEVFDTGELRAGESSRWVPSDTGTYRYRCSIHPRMRGMIVVEIAQ